MRKNRRTKEGWQASVRRIGTHAIVIGIHLGAWWLFFGDTVLPWSRPQSRTDQRLDSLSLRFIPVPAPPHVRMPSTARAAPSRRLPARMPVTAPAPRVVPPSSPSMTTPPAAPLGDYVAGGTLLHDNAPDFSPTVRLPGSGTPIVQGLHMIDPRMQGAAGVARALQTLFGVTNPHCVDVEVWRGMTTQERLIRHVSLAKVEHTAEEYHCGPG